MRTLKRRLTAVAATGLLVLTTTSVVSVVTSAPAAALTGSQFQAGNIISDAVFYNPNTMTAAGIQSFLNLEAPSSCPGTVCLNANHFTTTSQPAETGLCSAYTGKTGETAAQIFYNVAHACGVNPQALMVIAQKESSAITSSSPNYTTTMGYGCPDSTGCASKYYGFFNQVYLAARQFKLYRLHPTNYGYVAGQSNYILYNPKTSCGGSNVFISNQATAGLYDYTPYQPNAAALANLHGTGDSCSAYGNRNFWVFFNTWFPSQPGTGAPAPYDRGGLIVTHTDGTLWYYRDTTTATAPYQITGAIGSGWSAYPRLFTADINGDGMPDIVGVRSDGVAKISINDGTAFPFGTTLQIGTGWQQYTNVMAVHTTNSGRDDIAATTADGTLWLFRNQNNPAAPFAAPVKVGSGWNAYSWVGAGDFTGDGRTDLVAVKKDGTLWLSTNTGSVNIPWARISEIAGGGWLAFHKLIATDTTVDGLADLVAVHTDGSLWLYRNYGGSVPFNGSVKIGLSGWTSLPVVAGATLDVPHRTVSTNLVATQPAGTLWSSADEMPVRPYPTTSTIGVAGWTAYAKVISGDVTGDGKADLVAQSTDGTLWLYPNSGNAAQPYLTRIKIGFGWQGYTALTIADLTGDGYGDLIGVNSTGQLRLFTNVKSQTWPFPGYTVIGASGWLAFNRVNAVDLDGDGNPDLVVTNPAGALRVYYGAGGSTHPFSSSVQLFASGWPSSTQLVPIAAPTGAAHSPADLLARTSTGATSLHRFTGTRTAPFGAPETISASLPGLSRLLGGDVLGTGRTDLLGINTNGALTLSPSSGVDVLAAPIQIGASAWQLFDRITIGDVNADGLADLVATKPDGTLWMYLAGTTATHPYSASTEIGLGAWQQFDRLALGDVTGDGRADLVATRPDGSTWLYPAGTNLSAPYSARTQVLSGLQAYNRIALGDVSRDGVDDLVATKSDGTMWLFRNQRVPGLPFAAPVQIGSGWQAYNRFVLTDVNHDGRADVLATKSDGTLWYCAGTASATAPFPGCVPATATNWTAFDRLAA